MTQTAKMPPLWIIKMRAPFFTATLVPVLLGTAIVWARTGTFNVGLFLLTLIGAVALQAGTNMTNDYFDHVSQCDDRNTEFVNPFTGGSRVIQLGIVKPETMLWQGIAFFVLGGLIGLYLTWVAGPWVLVLGVVGVFSGYFYTAPPFRLVATGWGELLVGLNFGALEVLGTYYVQTGQLAWEPVLAAVPVSVLIALVLYINEFPDYKADALAEKRHLVVRWGRKKAALVYGILLAATYVSIVVGIALGVSPFALIGLLTAPIAWRAYQVARQHYDDPPRIAPANAATIQIHLLTGLLLSVGYVAQGVVRLVL
jgi:1,4-dihydroxy-2-naphthoate octaprenyltransferase